MELGWKEEKKLLNEKIEVLLRNIRNQQELFEESEKALKNGGDEMKGERDLLLKRVEDLVRENEELGRNREMVQEE